MRIVAVSGGFDPIHSGHLAMLRQAAAMGDRLVVGVNSDAWLTRKKGKPFMNIEERKAIVLAIKWVDSVWDFDDSDGTACDFLKRVKNYYQLKANDFVFANGGDRVESNNAELGADGWRFVYGIGGSDKKNSSSKLLKDWQNESSGGDSNNRFRYITDMY
jgi:D-beta-D-heptose 7-phosphate kinase/D-beta-D-heptose 1-phosphate adenosyltransferase